MMNTNKVDIGYGQVTYGREVEATPTSTETTGNVTINNIGQPGRPACFEVSFMISSDHSADEIEYSNIFNWKTVLVGHPKETPYSTIEAEAARQLAPMLRAMAQCIEDEVTAYDSRSSEK